MDLLKLIEQLVPVLGQDAADALAAEVEELISEQSPAWQRAILVFTADAIQAYGVVGISIAIDQIEKLMEDGEEPTIPWSNLLLASDMVAALQNAEEQQKTATREFLGRLGNILGTLLSGVIRGLLPV